MKITKRRVTKRNRIKRKYSKKRTKTRHSRKRVFSKKRRKRMLSKKKGGGEKNKDGTLLGKRSLNDVSTYSDSDSDSDSDTMWYLKDITVKANEEEKKMKELENEKSPVLLITTHGSVTSVDKKSPIQFKKINAAPLGCSNYLSELDAHFLAKYILKIIKKYSNNEEITTKIQEYMRKMSQHNCTFLKNEPETWCSKKYLRQEGHNMIHEFKINETYPDSEYSIKNSELCERRTHYDNTIELFHNNEQRNMFWEILGRKSCRIQEKTKDPEKEEQVLTLSKILEYLNHKGIRSLIIVNLSCSNSYSSTNPNTRFGGNSRNK